MGYARVSFLGMRLCVLTQGNLKEWTFLDSRCFHFSNACVTGTRFENSFENMLEAKEKVDMTFDFE